MEDSASEPVFQRAPEGLLKFFHEQGVSVADLAEPPIRTVRVTRRVPPGQAGRVMAELGGELGAAPAALRWLPNFWALPCSAPLANAAVARSGQVIGMEASSGVAVAALDVRRGDDVLEICCAPGAKLCMLADATGPTGSVTGVDVSPSRMAACRTLLRRCVIGCHALRDSQDKRAAGCDEGAEQCVAGAAAPTEAAAADADAEHSARPAASAAHARCRLLCGDGTMLALGPPEKDSYSSQAGLVCILDTAHPATYRSKRAPAFTRPGKRKRSPLTDSTDGALSQDLAAARRAQLDAAWAVLPPGCAYDRVLVDVECTHDASGKHVAKVLRGDAAAANAWADQLAHKTMELQPLQRQLALCVHRCPRAPCGCCACPSDCAGLQGWLSLASPWRHHGVQHMQLIARPE